VTLCSPLGRGLARSQAKAAGAARVGGTGATTPFWFWKWLTAKNAWKMPISVMSVTPGAARHRARSLPCPTTPGAAPHRAPSSPTRPGPTMPHRARHRARSLPRPALPWRATKPLERAWHASAEHTHGRCPRTSRRKPAPCSFVTLSCWLRLFTTCAPPARAQPRRPPRAARFPACALRQRAPRPARPRLRADLQRVVPGRPPGAGQHPAARGRAATARPARQVPPGHGPGAPSRPPRAARSRAATGSPRGCSAWTTRSTAWYCTCAARARSLIRQAGPARAAWRGGWQGSAAHASGPAPGARTAAARAWPGVGAAQGRTLSGPSPAAR